MYVCICKAVTDGQIREAVSEGCCSMRELRQCLGVATQCGRCAPEARQVLDAALAHEARGIAGAA
ncbi:MAG: BFD-like (2Fe-2S)-binding protein [Moraxellaceae bacterium]|jgi:bacterioferritin-associated ferredoxin|nr:BFD-like (2Fe-2S)-binding protein [Moraxellaceae bacterium]